MTTPTTATSSATSTGAAGSAASLLPIDAFINPFLACQQCGVPVTWHKDDRITNHPCGHQGIRSVCMTWSPAAGCICRERFGTLPHSGPSSVGAPAKVTSTTTTVK